MERNSFWEKGKMASTLTVCLPLFFYFFFLSFRFTHEDLIGEA